MYIFALLFLKAEEILYILLVIDTIGCVKNDK